MSTTDDTTTTGTTTTAGAAYVEAYRTRAAEQLRRLRARAADAGAGAGERGRAHLSALAAEAGALDEVDAALLAGRIDALQEVPGVRVGDFVRYAGGELERVSMVWTTADGEPTSVQTSRGGSFYLGNGGASFSGSLNPGCAVSTLVDTGTRRDGAVWFFHHDWPTAGGGRGAVAPFKVWSSPEVDSSR